jgi:hypothetical protein
MKQFRDTPYYITEDGEVYSNFKGKFIKRNPSICEGYYRLDLYGNQKGKFYFVHRLVAECFLPNPTNLPKINHKDTNKLNNHISNLEWITSKGNSEHASVNGLYNHGETHPKSKLNSNDIKWIRDNCIPNHKQFGFRPLSKKFNVSKTVISYIYKKQYWKHI